MKKIKNTGVGGLISNFGYYIKDKLGSASYTTKYKKIVVFGDEFSDIGRFGLQTKEQFPPSSYGFYKGRWTNGRVWIELLGQQMGINISLVDNYAIAGATSGITNIYSPYRKALKIHKDINIDGMLNQVNRYLENKPRINSHTLYILMSGSNDLKSFLLTGKPDLKNKSVADNFSSAIQLLADEGATEFLVCNLMRLCTTPEYSGKDNLHIVKEFCHGTNQDIETLVNEYKDGPLHIYLFDMKELFEQVYNEPEQYGFSYQDAYLPLDVIDLKDPLKEDKEIKFLHQENGMIADQFVFWWSISPSAPMHRIMAEKAYKLFEKKE